ncbi:MAG: hypothetical protein IKO96_02565 [Spirochaetales bacterium]|nr:hypothetical protein [Spirochaetales bacterium]
MSKKRPDQKAVLIEDASEALDYCLRNTDASEPVLAAGSFYLAGVIKEALCH